MTNINININKNMEPTKKIISTPNSSLISIPNSQSQQMLSK